MVDSGTTAKATTTDTAVTVIGAQSGQIFSHAAIINEGSVAGFFSVDGGTTWGRLPAGPSSIVLDGLAINAQAVQVKRVPSGSDLSGIWAFVW